MGPFITFEGIEGCGKTTQIQLLSDRLDQRGVEHLLTREPGGMPIGDQIRRLVLDPAFKNMNPTCELLLYAAARAQHIEEVIRPALAQSRLVLCDRFTDATLAYQGYGRGLSLDLIRRLHGLEILSLKPTRTVLFDIDVRTALERARHRDHSRPQARAESRFEQEAIPFHTKVASGYIELSKQEPERFIVIDARGGIRQVHERLVASLQTFFQQIGAGL